MKAVTVILLSGQAGDEAPAQVTDALRNRGFELFATRPLDPARADGLPEGFTPGGLAFVAFNPLMAGRPGPAKGVFSDPEVEKAAHLLAMTLQSAPRLLRVTRNAEQAQALTRALLSEPEQRQLQDRIRQRSGEMETDLPVLADLSRFKYRAKVELVEWKGAKAVKKTFRPNAMDAMARELAFHQDMTAVSPVPPRILAQFDNAILFEHIDNTLRVRRLFGLRVPVPLPLAQVRELADFVKLALARGWDPIDLSPRDNILIDARDGKLRAIDFEFAHRREAGLTAEQAYFLSGVPPGATVARPLNNDAERDPYPGKWRLHTGLDKSSFLNDPAWLQHLKRLCVHPFWLLMHGTGAMARRQRHKTGRDAQLNAIALSALPVLTQPPE